MYLKFDIKHYDKVFAFITKEMGYDYESFPTDDVVKIHKKDFATIKAALPDVVFNV